MKSFNKATYLKSEQRYLSLIFFLFGIAIMSLAPRTPDLKANLNINNGTFGSLLGSASIGSIIMLLIGGQIVHRIGSKRSLQIGSTAVAIVYIGLVHTSSPVLFLILNILAGASISIYHIATSGHSLHRQDEVGAVIVPKLHGAWAVGAMSTSAIAFLISNSVSITTHITILMLVVWLLTQICINKLTPTFAENPASDDDYQASSIKQFKFKINWFLSLGFFCATVLEFTIADWATLFGKEELGMNSSVATLCYLTCLLGLVVGRYSISWALNHQSEQFWIKTGGLVGSIGFTAMATSSLLLVDSFRNLAFALALIGFFLAGLGCSALAPIFFTIAGRLSNGKNALAVAQLSFINAVIMFISRLILAWIVELTSITIAFVIASCAMLSLVYFGRIGSNTRK
ncbi:MAG: MFS transporter [Candidatus Nanopelagicus sp.]|nr:MFS transporter [Candidatus Nanopelagicus sp.]